MILRDAMMAGSSRELLKIALLRLESGAAETACAQAAGTQIPKLVESTASASLMATGKTASLPGRSLAGQASV
jgi:hypothetical protein